MYLDFTQRTRHLQQIISQTEVGYDDAVAETACVTENRPELDKQKQWIINERLTYIAEHINEYPEVCIQYFVPVSGKSVERLLKFAEMLLKYQRQMQCSHYLIAVS